MISDPEEQRPFVLKARTLSAFMMVSAASSLYRRAQMRRCIRCESWFEFTREHAQFCSVLPHPRARQPEDVIMARIRKKQLSDDRIVYKVIWREGAGKTRRQRTKNFDRHAEARTFAAKMEREVEQRRVGSPIVQPSPSFSITGSTFSTHRASFPSQRARVSPLRRARDPRAWRHPARSAPRPGS